MAMGFQLKKNGQLNQSVSWQTTNRTTFQPLYDSLPKELRITEVETRRFGILRVPGCHIIMLAVLLVPVASNPTYKSLGRKSRAQNDASFTITLPQVGPTGGTSQLSCTLKFFFFNAG